MKPQYNTTFVQMKQTDILIITIQANFNFHIMIKINKFNEKLYTCKCENGTSSTDKKG